MSEQEEKCGATDDCLKGTKYAGLVVHTCELPKGHYPAEPHAEYGVSSDGKSAGLVTRWDDDGKHS